MAEDTSSSSRKSRSSLNTKQLVDQIYTEVTSYERKAKLPAGSYVLGRMIHLCKVTEKGQTQMSKRTASEIVADEIRTDWIDKNVYPKSQQAVSKQIESDFNELQQMVRYYTRPDKNKSEDWLAKASNFNKTMTKNAYDIRTRDDKFQKSMEITTGVKMTADDELFYEDNCKGKYVAICTRSVPTSWTKKKKREEKRSTSAEMKAETERTRSNEDVRRSLSFFEKNDDVDESMECASSSFTSDDVDFVQPVSFDSSIENIDRVTRSTPTTPSTPTFSSAQKTFPRVQTREGQRMINESLMSCVVQCLSEFKVSHRDLAGIMVRMANMVFGQSWVLPEQENLEAKSGDSESDDLSSENEQVPTKKRKTRHDDMTMVFPSRRCVSMYLDDAHILNLKLVAEYLVNKDEQTVITVGTDDTTKAAGHKLYDIKTDHYTIRTPQGKETLTTGFVENASHSGNDAAKAYEYKLKCLSILADTTVDEIKSNIDFWMTDRASDCTDFLEKLGVETHKVLKCCGHLVLGIDNAVDKVFRQVEQRIGVQKLLGVNAGDKAFLSPGSSVFTLGVIAIAKLLSPSHASHSVSLYADYINWMEQQNIEKYGFKGFKSNRFGRIAEIACQFLRMRDSILQFFETTIDIHSNKLVLAVSTYVECKWFVMCCELYQLIGDLIIFPLLDLLGIDNRGAGMKEQRDWYGVKDFFKSKIPEVEKLMEEKNGGNGQDRLLSAILAEVLDALNRQLSAMPFFHELTAQGEDVDESLLPDPDKLASAPLGNLGCESEFAWFDNRVRVSGGTESVSSISRKKVISTNGLLVNKNFTDMASEDRANEWTWARRSEQARQVKQLEKDFIATVNLTKTLSLAKKEEKKKKKNERYLRTLDSCKEHGGPVTSSTLDKLDDLQYQELLSEVSYLRLTIAPEIKQQRRVKDANGRYKMEKFGADELKTRIKNALKPENELNEDLNLMLMSAF